ncbi:MAG: nucleoside 2-deoxyribosyltransferase domain-containing protein [Patescibacteria group bacterium]|jgi:hypothetical protein
MRVVYWLETFPPPSDKSIFLAGPTPRHEGVQTWRPKALETLERLGYDGVVFVPEYRNGQLPKVDMAAYTDRIDWETSALARAQVIAFWVPRVLETMPAFTTNIEFGEWFKSGKIVLGTPPEARKVSYMRYRAGQHLVPLAETLEDTLKLALRKLGDLAK